MNEVRIIVPLIPPSVNHYKMRTRRGVTFVSDEAKAFKAAVAIFALGRSVEAKHYQLDVRVYFGKKGRGDGDNLFKCVGDGLKEAGVIHSDAAIKRWVMELDRDWENPRTDIRVRPL
jgi:Holliday junction resolvase RusA-like endonuclease